jgi:hypothetical protein
MRGTRTSYMESDFTELRRERETPVSCTSQMIVGLVKHSLTKRLSVVAPEFCLHVDHHQKDTIPGYTAELGYQVGQLRAE